MTATIVVTNNYFQDQAAFIAAAGLSKNTKFKKADLYAEIETWNRMQAEWDASEPETYEQVQADLNAATFYDLPANAIEVTADNNFDKLFVNWQQTKAEKAVKKVKAEVVTWTVEDIAIAQNINTIEIEIEKAKIINRLVNRYNMATVAIQTDMKAKKVRRYTHAFRLISASEKISQAYDRGLISWNKIVTVIQKSSLTVAEQEARLNLC